ncbi:MAG: sortase [Candidatus Peribacteraceae bacterium]|nr:sortase [Candidatus Peribacteraceae bacterium]
MRLFSLSAALVAAIVISATVFAAELPYEAYAPAVIGLQNAGVIDKPVGNDVRVRDTVNRAEALKIILRSDTAAAQQVDREKGNISPIPLFTDIDQKAWYAPYVETGFDRGLVKGYPDGTFKPGSPVTVAEAVVLVARLYGENAAGTAFRTSTDLPNKSGEWYSESVSAIIARNAIMKGSLLTAGKKMTRGELFDLVYRMRTVTLKNLTAYSESAATVIPAPAPASQNGNVSQSSTGKSFAMSIPSIGITDLPIIHPADPYTQKGVLAVLEDGVGHLMGYPGGGGKIMIYGHSSGWPWDLSQYTKIFRTINKLTVGSSVYVTYNGAIHTYQVTEKKTVQASDRTMFESDDEGEMLILYTCWPPDSIQQRYLVIAKPVTTVLK